MNKKILILGAFGIKNNSLSGQTIKTRNIFTLLDIKKNEENFSLDFFDTSDLKYNNLAIFNMLAKVFKCDILFFLPAHNNLNYGLPLFFLMSKITNFSIIYTVIGGWLSDFIRYKWLHRIILRRIMCILPETQLLKQKLNHFYNINNTIVFPNFRIQSFNPKLSNNSKRDSLRLVFMSRINKMKGYDMIFNAAKYFENNNLNISIDFYGQIHGLHKDDFLFNISNHKSTYYKGVLEPKNIYKTLSHYDLLMLPTKYYTEGLPGAIVDAYISGVPVIVTEWLHAREFVDHGITGYIIPFENGQQEFIETIIDIYNNQSKIKELKKNALNKSKEFSVDYAWAILKPLILDKNK